MKATTGVVAAAVAFLAQKVPGIEMYLNEYVLTGVLWVIIDYLYGLIPESVKKKYGKEIQETLNLFREAFATFSKPKINVDEFKESR